jgi:Uncharacterised protein family (UPF0175)
MSVTQITFELPEDIARRLGDQWRDLPRAALESLALEAYRAEILTTAELQELLGYDTPYALDGFLKQHGVYLEYTPEELDREAENSRHLWRQRQKELQAENRQRRAG